jgi:hypothetical protein
MDNCYPSPVMLGAFYTVVGSEPEELLKKAA